MLILIDGYWGSGKSVLRGLLDGHQNLFVSPIQDSIPGAFARDNENPKWYKYKDIEHLREILASKSQYYRIERLSYNQKIQLDFSSKDRTYIDINIDFPTFDQSVVKRLLAKKLWKPESICNVVYKTMLDSWHNHPVEKRNVKAYVSMDNNHIETLRFFLENFDDGKLLYTIRSPEGIIATRSKRRPIKEDYRTEKWANFIPEQLIKAGEVKKIIKHQQEAFKLKNEFPDKIKILNFEDIIENTEKTMLEVSSFLDIPFEDTMTSFTHLGKEITSNGKKYVGKIHDKPEDLLDKEQLILISLQKQRSNYLRELLSHPMLVLKSLYIELKLSIKFLLTYIYSHMKSKYL